MKRLSLIVTLLLTLMLAACHTSREVTAQDLEAYATARTLIDNQSFMITARRVSFAHKTFPSVSSNTNFLIVDGAMGTVQVSPAMSGGPNGVGGFTVTGTISGYKVKESKSNIDISYHVQAFSASCDVVVKIHKDSNEAVATISNTFRGKAATVYGNLVPIDNSVYTGRAPF